MHTFRSVKFTTHLFWGILVILVVSLTAVITVSHLLVAKGLESYGRTSLENANGFVFKALTAHDQHIREQLNFDIRALESEMTRLGPLSLDSQFLLDRAITNQLTMTTEQARIPRLLVGQTQINGNTDVLDRTAELTGGMFTIFQVLGNKLLRVSSTIRIRGEERAVGIYLPADSPIYTAVMQGDTYSEKSLVAGQWCLTTYKPLRDETGTVVAVLCAARKILTPEIQTLITTTKALGVGYFFVYDPQGVLIIHPKLEGKNLFSIKDGGEHFRNTKAGFVDYPWDGEDKIAYTQFFKPWGCYLAVGLNKNQMVQSQAVQITRDSALVGLGAMLLGVLYSLMLTRTIAKPLNKLAAKSLAVAKGDYTITFGHSARDAIGNLASAINTMVVQTKEMLSEITTATTALAVSSEELSDISASMTSGSAQTANMANTVSSAASEVSSNMNSVSAAMEQASVNVNTVATAAEQMSITIQEIAQNSERAKNTTANAVVKAQETSGRVNELGVAAKEISAVTATITAISSQTNLLALNATIEAARAGEAGRGFAVVANEIKELALQTAKATEDIRGRISGIQSVTKQTVHEIADISEVIGEMNGIVGTIAAAVEEQSVTTRDIAENVGQASAGIREINENVASSSTKTRSISADIDKVRIASVEMTTSSQSVQASAGKLARLAERLSELVSHFRI